MHIPQFTIHAKKRFPYCVVGKPAGEADFSEAEKRLGVSIPEKVKVFYRACDGIKFHEPFLRVLPLSELRFSDKEGMLVFCVLAKDEEIAFDTSELNRADQWSIIGLSENREITVTMASFWSKKIWGWLDNGRPIWSKDEYQDSE